MRILVTGGAGFVGSQYVRSLLNGSLPGPAPTRVTVVDKLTYSGNLANLREVRDDTRLEFVRGDVTDEAVVEALAPGRDALRHGTGRFVQVSTDEVYGSIDAGSWAEDQPVAPRSPYAASKAGADLLALAYHHTHGLDVVVTRGSNTYGPYQHPEKVIPRFVTALLSGGTVPLYGDGLHVRDWVHVRDHCAGIALALARGRAGEVYHLGGGVELTNRELTGRLLAACGAGWERVEQVADRKGHDRRYSLETGKARAELGWAPTVDFDAGLAETVAWYRDNRDWWAAAARDAAAD